VHEVGRTRLVDLSAPDRPNAPSLHPTRPDLLGWWSGPRFTIAMAAAGLTGLLLYWSLKPRGVQRHRIAKLIVYTPPFVILGVGLLAVGGVLLDAWLARRPGEEPIYFGQGVSVWPTVWLRLLAGLLSMHFLAKALHAIHKNNLELTREFRLRPPPNRTAAVELRARSRRASRSRARRFLYRQRALLHGLSLPCRSGAPAAPAAPPKGGWLWRGWLRVMGTWRIPRAETLDAIDLWRDYRRRGTLAARAARFLPAAALYGVIGWCVAELLGWPHVPYRGDLTRAWEKVSLVFSVTGLVVLMFFVVDAVRLCERFTEHVCRRTDWPPELTRRAAADHGLAPADLDEYLDVEIIGRRSEVVLGLIYYPFIVLGIMIVSRNSYFDNWDWPAALLLIFAANAAYALVCGWVLRQACERARRSSVQGVRNRIRPLIGSKAPDDEERRARLVALAGEIEANRRGAFASFSHNPVIRALLLPSGGFGLWALLEYFSKN
jgi:hypothetical protein